MDPYRWPILERIARKKVMRKKSKVAVIIDDLISENEAAKRLSLKVKRRKARIRPKSKVAGAASRRNPNEDFEIFQLIRASMAKGHDTILDSGSRPSVRKWKDKIYLKDRAKHEGTEKETRTIWSPDWTHTGDRLKLLALGAVITGDAYAFTLRIGKKEIEAAYASPRGFVGYFTERMKRAFSKAGDPSPQYAFIVEASVLHEEHLHGIISSRVTAIRPVLAQVGGQTDMKAKERQVHTKKIFNLLGWADYIAKAPLTTADTLLSSRKRRLMPHRQDRLIGAPTYLRGNAKAWYQAQRKSGEPIPVNLGSSSDGSSSILDSAGT